MAIQEPSLLIRARVRCIRPTTIIIISEIEHPNDLPTHLWSCGMGIMPRTEKGDVDVAAVIPAPVPCGPCPVPCRRDF